MRYPFEAPLNDLEANIDSFVDAVFENLESDFLVMPKGKGFIDYPTFEEAYQELRVGTHAFTKIDPVTVSSIVEKRPLSLIVLRTILGFTPPEWAYVASRRTGTPVTQGYARTVDRRIRMNPLAPLRRQNQIEALVFVACQLVREKLPAVEDDQISRLDKVDTQQGIDSLQHLSKMGVPYAMLLYERFLGRPFASHRDSVSELIGGGLESAIEDILSSYKISYRKTKRADKVPNFDPAPDFIIPDEFSPQVIIESKITEDDGTARDKIARIQLLDHLSKQGTPDGERRFQVIACIAGRGFGIRREDMKKLILATDGKVFTLKDLNRLVPCSSLEKLAIS